MPGCHVEQYRYLLRKLREMKGSAGSVLDHSMILFGSALSDDKHDPHRLPLVLDGRSAGRIASGQRLVCGEDARGQSVRIHAGRVWTPIQRFADSTGPLLGVLARVQ